MMLVDPDNPRTVYVQMSDVMLDELKSDWSHPVQVRVEGGEIVLRRLAQPVKGVYITDDEEVV